MADDRGLSRNEKPLLLALAIIFILLLLLVIAAVLSICNYLSVIDNPNIARSPYYEYIIKVRGIENFDAPGGVTSLYFPVPLYNGSPVLPFSGRLDHGVGDYGHGSSPYDSLVVGINRVGYHGTRYISPIDTGNGPMLEARFNDTDYTEVDYHRAPKQVNSFDKMDIRILYPIGPAEDRRTNTTVQGLIARPLYPDAGALPTNFTGREPGENATGYTSYLYIDEGLRPLGPGSTLEIYASFVIRLDDHPYGMNLNNRNHLFMINESIPGNVTGFIPVKVQYMGEYSSMELHMYMDNFYRK